jgi:hypothetical protein
VIMSSHVTHYITYQSKLSASMFSFFLILGLLVFFVFRLFLFIIVLLFFSTSTHNTYSYKQIEIALMDKWKSYLELSGPSSLQWLDDGPLADPKLFGGYWVPWRDEEGLPYSTYSALGTSLHDNIASGEMKDTATEKGEGDGSGDKTWKLTPDQKESMKESHAKLGTDARVQLAAQSSSSSPSNNGVSHPYLLLGSGAVLGAVATVAVVTHLNKRSSGAKYSPV